MPLNQLQLKTLREALSEHIDTLFTSTHHRRALPVATRAPKCDFVPFRGRCPPETLEPSPDSRLFDPKANLFHIWWSKVLLGRWYSRWLEQNVDAALGCTETNHSSVVAPTTSELQSDEYGGHAPIGWEFGGWSLPFIADWSELVSKSCWTWSCIRPGNIRVLLCGRLGSGERQ